MSSFSWSTFYEMSVSVDWNVSFSIPHPNLLLLRLFVLWETIVNLTDCFSHCRLKNSLPAGTSYICMDNRDLPNILKSILSSIHN